MVVPEIEMPGHAGAAARSYPEYFDAAGGHGAVRTASVTVTAPLVPAQPGEFTLEVKEVATP